MEKRRNLCAMIPETLHAKVREEQEKQELTLSQYVGQPGLGAGEEEAI